MTLIMSFCIFMFNNQEDLVHQASSSTHFELTISNPDTSTSTKASLFHSFCFEFISLVTYWFIFAYWLCEKEPNGDQEAVGEGTSLNEGPSNDLCSKETTKKAVNATTTEMTSPLVNSCFFISMIPLYQLTFQYFVLPRRQKFQ